MCLTTPKFTKRKVTWVVDSGATIHCVNDLSCITRIYENYQPVRIKVANNETLTATVVGECEVSLRDTTGRNHTITLPYLELIGSLLYLSTMTLPEISYHLSVLCSFMHDPSPDCYYAAIDLLLYVSHMYTDHTYTFTGSCAAPRGVDPERHGTITSHGGLVAYSDSTWRRPDKLGYNAFGYVVYLYGAPVSFAAKRLKVVALSSAEGKLSTLLVHMRAVK